MTEVLGRILLQASSNIPEVIVVTVASDNPKGGNGLSKAVAYVCPDLYVTLRGGGGFGTP